MALTFIILVCTNLIKYIIQDIKFKEISLRVLPQIFNIFFVQFILLLYLKMKILIILIVCTIAYSALPDHMEKVPVKLFLFRGIQMILIRPSFQAILT